MDLLAIIRLAADKGASDVHLVVDNPPIFRIHGMLHPAPGMSTLTNEDIEKAFQQIATAEQRTRFQSDLELDFSYTVPDVGRVRANAAKQRGSLTMVIRLIKSSIPTAEQLGLPEVYKELIIKPRGLVVVTGPTGSGKSTTLSAMINYLNDTESRRVVTIEDPIEFIYTDNKCTITQRELGSDTRSFDIALRHALRQDPDVILVGEMRDLETASAVLTSAETGHLVLTTGHAMSASQSVERIIDLFPPHERPLVQSRLASLLIGIFCQTLVPKIDGSGRVAAIEVMLATTAIRNNIREGKIYQIPNSMMTKSRPGMMLLNQALVSLYQKGVISRDNALSSCNDPDEMNKLITQPEANLSQM